MNVNVLTGKLEKQVGKMAVGSLNQYLNSRKFKLIIDSSSTTVKGVNVGVEKKDENWLHFPSGAGWKIDAFALFKYEDWLIFPPSRSSSFPISL